MIDKRYSRKHLSRRFLQWRAVLDKHLEILNEDWSLGLNVPYYEIGFRGKNHRMVLLRDGDPICAGMTHITHYVMYVRGIKHWYEGVINEKTNHSI